MSVHPEPGSAVCLIPQLQVQVQFEAEEDKRDEVTRGFTSEK